MQIIFFFFFFFNFYRKHFGGMEKNLTQRNLISGKRNLLFLLIHNRVDYIGGHRLKCDLHLSL